MKMIFLGAAGLLLSGTALSAADLGKGMAPPSAPVASKATGALGESMIGNATLIDWPVKNGTAAPVTEAKTMDAPAKALKAKPEPAAADAPSTTAMADPANTAGKASLATYDGMGGPDEPVAAAAPAASYRACSPGPGDDNCIQLYEPGVRASYAAWQAANLPGAAQTGMGGPEEPVDTATEAKDAGDSDKLASYDEPLPEDLVMSASDDLAEADVTKNDTLAL